MGLWDFIRDWFGRASSEETPTKAPPVAPVKPRPDTVPIVDAPDDTVPFPGDTGVDIFRLLFSNKDKHTTTMLNSISLSSDMKTLYLIDNGRAIPFDLTVPQGVLVGLLGDQLVVATAVNRPQSGELPVEPDPTAGEEVNVSGGRGPEPVLAKHTFKAGENSQYTVSYNSKNRALGIIGVDDIVIHLEAPEDVNCTDKVFSLENEQILNIRWERDELQIVELSGKG